MIIVIGGIKGGSGKTTLATNFTVIQALKGEKVLLVDADDQRSSSDWAEQRESLVIHTPWTTIQLYGPSVSSQVKKMKDNYDQVIIDTGGRDTTSQRAALTIADLFLSPFQPRSLDVWTLNKLSSLLQEVEPINPLLKTFAVINRGDILGKDNKEAYSMINQTKNIQCLPAFISQRKAFSNAIAEGLSVVELKPSDKKAIDEITSLNDALFKEVALK